MFRVVHEMLHAARHARKCPWGHSHPTRRDQYLFAIDTYNIVRRLRDAAVQGDDPNPFASFTEADFAEMIAHVQKYAKAANK
jgi:hypothetical protein